MSVVNLERLLQTVSELHAFTSDILLSLRDFSRQFYQRGKEVDYLQLRGVQM